MTCYLIHGVRISSEMVLSGIKEYKGLEDGEITIRQRRISDEFISKINLSEHGAAYYMKDNLSEFYFTYRNQGCFKISNGNEIIYDLQEGFEKEVVEDLLLRRCLHFIFYQRNILIVHGSGIVHDDECVLITGESGVGKSTMTEYLIGNGYKYVGDDQIRVDIVNRVPMAMPSFPRRKIQEDGISLLDFNNDEINKVPIFYPIKYNINDFDNFYKTPVRVKWIINLKTDECKDVYVTELNQKEKLNLTIESEYGKAINQGLEIKKGVFVNLVQLSGAIKAYVIYRPIEGDYIKEIYNCILEIIESGDKDVLL